MTVYNLLIEAVFVGIFSIIVGFIVENVLEKLFKNSNIYYTRIISLFLAGFFAYLLFQFIGIDKRYHKEDTDTLDTSVGIDKRYRKEKTYTFDTSIIHPASL